MSATYVPSYIDAILDRRDAAAVYTVITVLQRTHQLPRECVLFRKVYEWLGVDWQYYENLSPGAYEEMIALLAEFGLEDVRAKFEEAMAAWNRGDMSIGGIDEWSYQQHHLIVDCLIGHVQRVSHALKPQKG